jgi:hypothetical protein
VALRESRQAEACQLVRVALAVEREDDLERGAGAAEAADVAQRIGVGQGEGAQEAAPGQERRHPVGGAVELRRQRLERGDDVEDVRQAAAGRLARGAPGVFAERGGIRVDADEEALGRAAGAIVGVPAVTGTEVDRDAAPVGGKQLRDLRVAESIEPMAAYDDHRGSSLVGTV